MVLRWILGVSMKVGDLVTCWDSNYGIGIVIEVGPVYYRVIFPSVNSDSWWSDYYIIEVINEV